MSEFNIRERSDKVDIYDEKIIIQYWEELLIYNLITMVKLENH
jgi:hypothetical protein